MREVQNLVKYQSVSGEGGEGEERGKEESVSGERWEEEERGKEES